MPNTTINCPNCGARFQATIEQLIDVSLDPSAKSRLLSGRLNVAQCPNCGFVAPLATPIAYHDADKQLLIVHVPMELNLPKTEMERVIGTFTTAVQNSLPPEKRKGYLFTPKQALTRQALVDIILEADGITKEMIEAQRDKMKLVEQFLSTPPDQIEALVKEHDDKLDAEFFSLMLAAAEQTLAAGREDVAQAVVAIRDQLIQLSTWGQQAMASQAKQQDLIQEVAGRLNALGQGVTRETLLDLVIELGREDDEKVQVAVGLARAAFDGQFFQILSTRIENEADADEKAHLENIRKRLTELVGIIDQQNEAVIRRATDTLRGLISLPPEELDNAIQSRLELFDDTFLAVLQANIQAAEQARDVATAAKLKMVFERIVGMLQTSAPPAIQFINRLMTYQNFEEARAIIQQEAPNYGPELLQWIDVLIEDLSAQGGTQAVERLQRLRAEAEQVLSNAPAQPADVAPASRLTDAPPPATPRLLTKDEPDAPPPSGKIIELPSFRRGPRRER